MSNHRHFIMHKPAGCLSQLQTNQRRQQKKRLLSDFYDFPEGCMAVGRLDYYSEGLLLITTDGKLSNHIRSRDVEKEYYAELDGIITGEAIRKLENGVEISINGKTYTTLPCRITRTVEEAGIPPLQNTRVSRHRPVSWVSITITEGKFRQVRKMTAAVGFPTLRLIRIRLGHVNLGNMTAGEVQEVNKLDFDALAPEN